MTEEDVLAGSFTNTVVATVGELTKTADDSITTANAESGLTVTKTANPTGDVKVGDEITYTVVVTNSGNVSVKDGRLEDDHADLSEKTFTLAPNETAEFTYTYTVTQADIDVGKIVNNVKANATAVRGDDPAEVEDSATVAAEEAGISVIDGYSLFPHKDLYMADSVHPNDLGFAHYAANIFRILIADGAV